MVCNPSATYLEIGPIYTVDGSSVEKDHPMRRTISVSWDSSCVIRDLKIEVFRHFLRTENVKKSRDQCVGVRFAV